LHNCKNLCTFAPKFRKLSYLVVNIFAIMAQKKCALCKRQKSDANEIKLLPNFLLPLRNRTPEVQSRIDALRHSHIFCPDCYQRIKGLDKAYRTAHFSHHHNPVLNYLFWMSVVWRIAISKGELHMLWFEREKLRHILNLYLPSSYSHWQTPPPEVLGKCPYRLQKVERINNEALTLVAVHEPSCPYVIILGPYVLKWYAQLNKFIAVAGKVGDDIESVNLGFQREKIEHISVFDYCIDIHGIEQTNRIYDRKMSSFLLSTLPDVTTIRPFPKELREQMNQPLEDMDESYGRRVDVMEPF